MTATIDISSPTANMYGCEPCPKCRSKYRYPATCAVPKKPDDDGSLRVFCDDCGHVEPGVVKGDE